MNHTLKIRWTTRLEASRLAQIGLLGLFWFAGEALARLVHAPIPGSLLGLLALVGLLGSGALDVRFVERGATWLLAEMLLFFVPAVVALLAHPEFIGYTGLKVLLVILGSTIMVMLATALTVEFGLRWMAAQRRPVPNAPLLPPQAG